MLIVGCDPGLKGAIALLDGTAVIDVVDMPIHENAVKGKLVVTDSGDIDRREKIVRHVDIAGVAEILRLWRLLGAEIMWTELVGSRPEDGTASAFKFGKSAGAVVGAGFGAGLTVREVAPATWKRRMNLTFDKKTSLEMARSLFPASLDRFKLQKHDGRAEAALIGVYGLRFGA